MTAQNMALGTLVIAAVKTPSPSRTGERQFAQTRTERAEDTLAKLRAAIAAQSSRRVHAMLELFRTQTICD